jgi:proteasome accessory factor B
VSQAKTERLLNLTMCLMATSRYLTVAEIGRRVAGYDPGDTEEKQVAFRRMFERDKEDLRELGVPLEVGTNAGGWDDEQGYRIRRSDYALPEIRLEPDEAAALGLAARLWTSARLADDSVSAVRKLQAGGVPRPSGPAGLEPRVDATEPAFDDCYAAVRSGRLVAFDYRKPAAVPADRRVVEPWGLVSWHGHWYLVGHDRHRDAARVFRLSRIVGRVRPTGPPGAAAAPPGVDLRALIAAAQPDTPVAVARLRLRPGTGHALRRRAQATGDPGDVVALPYRDVERFADELVGFGADAVVVDPPELRAAVVRRLRAARS